MDREWLEKHWWSFAIRGAVAIIFWILTLLMPGISLALLITLFGVYALVDGILNIVTAVRGRAGRRKWLVLEGLVSIGAGLVSIMSPGITAIALVYVIAFWALVTGMLEIFTAIRLRKEITGEFWLILGGILSLAFGALLTIAPGAGALALVMWIGVFAIAFGALLVALGFRLRRRHVGEHAESPRYA
jgi:uncharacterized membrane protein HdeD (DUF308 family)